MTISERIASELNIKLWQAEAAIGLIEEGNTIPFIARYRKEAHGQLDDQLLRKLEERLTYLKNLEGKKAEVIRLIDEQGKLTEEIEKAVAKAETVTEVDDIYRPFRPKRRTRATMAREKGLAPLAEMILAQNTKDEPLDMAKDFVSEEKGVESAEKALDGAKDIIAEGISDDADIRRAVREYYIKNAAVVTKGKKDEDSVYSMYYDRSESVAKIQGHRVLAIDRGEKEDFLSVKIEAKREDPVSILRRKVVRIPLVPSSKAVIEAAEDAYDRLIAPSIENEIRNIMTERAHEGAIEVFGDNLRHLLLQPPVKGRVVMGFDPAYRTGCKIAVVNELGDVLETAVVYPTPPQNKKDEAEKKLLSMIERHGVDIISIGNGTASKESEIFVAETIKKSPRKLAYMVVSESGATVYSASKLGVEEFPDLEGSLRRTVSIA